MKAFKKPLTLFFLIIALFAMLFALSSCADEDGMLEQYKEKSFTVTFDTNGGSEVKSQTLKYGEHVSQPEIPTKEGYFFDGWYFVNAKWTFMKDKVTGPLNLTARWIEDPEGTMVREPSKLTIQYIRAYPGSTSYDVIDSETVEYTAESFPMVLEPKYRNDFYFVNWCIDTETGEVIDEITAVEDITIYAAYYAADSSLNYLYNEELEGYVVSHASFSADCAVIPDMVNDRPVVGIASDAFFGYANRFIFPSTIKSIGDRVFRNFKSIETMTLPEGLTSIGNSTFEGCTALRSINIPSGVTSIGTSAFNGCTALENISLPETLETIGDMAFYGCEALTEITLPEALTGIGAQAFEKCYALSEINIPESVVYIGENAFANDYDLVINVAREEAPEGWHENWNASFCEVNWKK